MKRHLPLLASLAVPLLLLCAVGSLAAALYTAAVQAQEDRPAAAPEPAPPTEGTEGPREEGVTVVLEPGQRPLLRLAFPEVDGIGLLSGVAGEAARELDETLRGDLDEARIFEIQGPWAFRRIQTTGDFERDREIYRSLGNELLLSAEMSRQGDKILFEGRVFDLASGDLVLGKRYRGEYSVARRIAHTFADEVILYFTGQRGVALTALAFHSDRTGDKEVFLMDYDGANERRVTGHRSVSLFPAWTPDGTGLAYVSFLSGTPGIYHVDVTTGAKRPVVTEGRLNTSPSYSADGRYIAFARSLEGNTEIFVARRDGSGARRLTHSRAIDTSPAWSPTGSEIAFTSGRGGRPDIWVMDAEGTNLQRLSSSGNYNDGAAWSPDGTRIAYSSRIGGVFQIVVTDRVTLETQVLTTGGGDKESPTFSPDGRRIAFTISLGGRSGKQTQVWVMDADGRNPRQLTHEGNNYSPAWSPYPPS